MRTPSNKKKTKLLEANSERVYDLFYVEAINFEELGEYEYVEDVNELQVGDVIAHPDGTYSKIVKCF